MAVIGSLYGVVVLLFFSTECMHEYPEVHSNHRLLAFYRSQEIDMFGEISGVCFSPQADKFFVGIADATYSSLLQFNQHTYQSMMGSV